MSVFRCQCMCCLRRDKELSNYNFLIDSSLSNNELEQQNKQLREDNKKLWRCIEFALRETVMHACDKEIIRNKLKEIGGNGE